MDLLKALQGLLGGGANDAAGAQAPRQGGGNDGGLGGMLTPEMLGGIASALFAGKGGAAKGGGGLANTLMGAMSGGGGGGGGLANALMGAIAGNQGGGAPGGGAAGLGGLLGSLLGGGGGGFFGEQAKQVASANAGVQGYGSTPTNPQDRAARSVRAMVYAAKCDGRIDANEQAAIFDQLNRLNLGPQGQEAVRRIMAEPVDPDTIANGVRDGEEALRLYTLSRVVINPDLPAERKYLDALAQALRIPSDVRSTIESRLTRG